jgi:hypothetical protein
MRTGIDRQFPTRNNQGCSGFEERRFLNKTGLCSGCSGFRPRRRQPGRLRSLDEVHLDDARRGGRVTDEEQEMARHNNDETERLIAEYLAATGTTRTQLANEWLLDEMQLAALERLHDALGAAMNGEDVIVPDGLPGAGKRYGDLTESEQEHLSALEVEMDDLDHEHLDG